VPKVLMPFLSILEAAFLPGAGVPALARTLINLSSEMTHTFFKG
jgi:hypothetical protein